MSRTAPARPAPLDPDSEKGRRVAADLAEVFAQIRVEQAARRAQQAAAVGRGRAS